MAKSKQQAQNSKIAWIKKHWIMLAVVVVFAGVGAYLVGMSSAATKWYASFLNSNCVTRPTLYEGHRGHCVRAVQRGLNNRNENLKRMNGIQYTRLAVDGIYGPATKSAVLKYQNDKKNVGKKLPADGKMNQATWDIFLNDCLVFSYPESIGQPGKGGVALQAGYACR